LSKSLQKHRAKNNSRAHISRSKIFENTHCLSAFVLQVFDDGRKKITSKSREQLNQKKESCFYYFWKQILNAPLGTTPVYKGAIIAQKTPN